MAFDIKPLKWNAFAQMAVLAALLSGCMSLSGERRMVSAPMATSVPDSAVLAEQTRLVATFGGEYAAPAPLLDLVREIVGKIVAASDDPTVRYRLTVLNSPSINAFALPTGELYVTRGLLALANDTSEIAAVLAHEVGHVTAKHATQRAEFERQATTAMPDSISGPNVATSRFLLASFSRGQELEADEIGIRTIAKAGYDPYGAARFLASLSRQTTFMGEIRPSARYSFLSSHPSTPQRLAAALETARANVGATAIEADRTRYLTALNGIAYGDDPFGGVVRGRRFLHTRLDFMLLAPEGFVLENSPQAVIGVSANGQEALRLDTVRLGGAGPEAALAGGWIDGATNSEITLFTINGLSGATATARASEWTFRLAAIQKGDDIFRIIFAAREMNQALDRAFLASIGSFRTLTPEEKAGLRPQRVEAVLAGADDTPSTLLAKSDRADNALDRFLVLNGLDRPKLRPGELYKLVVSEQ